MMGIHQHLLGAVDTGRGVYGGVISNIERNGEG
jgi:hypothetical protein